MRVLDLLKSRAQQRVQPRARRLATGPSKLRTPLLKIAPRALRGRRPSRASYAGACGTPEAVRKRRGAYVFGAKKGKKGKNKKGKKQQAKKNSKKAKQAKNQERQQEEALS